MSLVKSYSAINYSMSAVLIFISLLGFFTKSEFRYATYDMFNTCTVIYDGIDLKTKKYRKELAPEHLFYYSPQVLKNDLQAENLLKAQAQLLKIEEKVYFNINVEIYSHHAALRYGEVKPGDILSITTIDGKSYKLLCKTGSKGEKSKKDNSYIFALSYEIDKSSVKSLQKMEIDHLGIQWSSGYEEYTIYEVDFLTKQIACLNQ